MQATLSCSSCCSFRADKERTTMHFLLISGLLSLVIGHGSATPTPLATDSDAQMPAASVSFLVNSDRDRDQQRPAVARAPDGSFVVAWDSDRSEEHTSELQSLMRIAYAVFC